MGLSGDEWAITKGYARIKCEKCSALERDEGATYLCDLRVGDVLAKVLPDQAAAALWLPRPSRSQHQ